MRNDAKTGSLKALDTMRPWDILCILIRAKPSGRQDLGRTGVIVKRLNDRYPIKDRANDSTDEHGAHPNKDALVFILRTLKQHELTYCPRGSVPRDLAE